jgi:hypothetical protein
MTKMNEYAKFAMLAATAAIAMNVPAAKAAESAIGVAVSAPMTPVTFGVFAVVTVLANEAFAEKPFGENGEIMKVLAAPIKIIDGNVKASERESGEIAKVLRATTGISVRDIVRYGVFGGPNSVFRKPFG